MDSLEIIQTIAPEFVDLDAITGAISIADMQIAPNLCGDKRPLLVAYLAAHILTIAGRKLGATGDIASISEGRQSITYANSTAKIDSGLSMTSHGREYDRLSRACIFAARTRICNGGIG